MATPEQKETIQKVLNDERSIVSYPQRQKTEESINFYLNALEENAELFDTEEEVKPVVVEQMSAIFSVYIGAMLGKLALDVYKNHFTKAARACKGMPGGEKGICMLRAKIAAKEKALSKLQGGIRKCSKDRNPEKCRSQVNGRINKLSTEIKYLNQRQGELRGAAIVH